MDRRIAELGLNADRIRKLRSSQDADTLETYIFPLYLRLRAEGFKHYPDLIA